MRVLDAGEIEYSFSKIEAFNGDRFKLLSEEELDKGAELEFYGGFARVNENDSMLEVINCKKAKGFNTEILIKLEGSFLEKNKYPATEELIRNYELEINHICEITHNKKHFETDIKEHAALRSNVIISEIVESMESDEQAYKKSIHKKKRK